ncbi:MAG: hypothetical protein K2X66_15465, partial [Cyanobacteria bacterium]|nr:hypothetical protein [Cyanobacteriota bacterium]
YYWVVNPNSSFGVVNQMFQTIHHIPQRQMIIGLGHPKNISPLERLERAILKPIETTPKTKGKDKVSTPQTGSPQVILEEGPSKVKSLVVVLDDLAGSGDSLGTYFNLDLRELTDAGHQVYMAPIISTEKAWQTHFSLLTQLHPGLTYAPHQTVKPLHESEGYKSLSVLDQIRIDSVIQGRGYTQSNTSVVFPWMGSDTNNAFWRFFMVEPHTLNGNGNKKFGNRWKPLPEFVSSMGPSASSPALLELNHSAPF